MATIKGLPADRPPVCFYEINGFTQTPNDRRKAEKAAKISDLSFTQNPDDPDPFNIYSDPSWRPLLDLARVKSDVIVTFGIPWKNAAPPSSSAVKTETYISEGSRFFRTVVTAGNRTLTSLARRDPDVNTVWTTEHLCKDLDDFRAYLKLPEERLTGEPDTESFLEMEKKVGDAGIVMLDTADPIGAVAPLFTMEDYTVTALTEKELFHRALERAAAVIYARVEAAARALPGRLWRICGPEYASPPYLPPGLFYEYVVKYVKPMVDIIHKHGGFARIHSHGRLKAILDHIVSTGCMGLDPVEPPPQGDVELAYVRKNYGKDLVLFGNLEASDIENLSADKFREKVKTALDEGTRGSGRGFVLMPSACPYGRKLSPVSMRNYEVMIEETERL
jgi:uroporphyrinogen-III decarboxylase